MKAVKDFDMQPVFDEAASILPDKYGGIHGDYGQGLAAGILHERGKPNKFMPEQDVKDIKELHEIALRHAQHKDGLDQDVIEHIQKLQQIIMMRAGGRCYQNINEANGTTNPS